MNKARMRARGLDRQALDRVGGGFGYDFFGSWQNDNPYSIPGGSWNDFATPETGGGGGGLCKNPFSQYQYPDLCGGGPIWY